MRTAHNGRVIRTAAFVLGVGVLGIFALLPSASATTQPTASAASAPDLSTVPKVKSYLRSLGVDPRGVVVQRGERNYAGPNCPGPSWNCTMAQKVIQISARADDDDNGDDDENRFVCKRNSGSGSVTQDREPPEQSCTIVQENPNSNNSATCDIETHQRQGTITQTCFITQSGKRNKAVARQVAGMSASGTDQDVFQTISVRQTSSGSGGNNLETAQSALLRSHGDGSEPVTQDVHQTTCGNQNAAGVGPNVARAGQAQTLIARKDGAESADIAQNVASELAECSGPATPFPDRFHPDTGDCAVDAFSDAKESANACTRIHQISGSGKNTIRLGQLDSLLADVDDTEGGVTIAQGNPMRFTDPNQTGTDATLDQESSGLSQIFDEGVTTQFAVLEDLGGFFTVNQTDEGPRCCAAGHQTSNDGNDFSIKGRLVQRVYVDGELAEEPSNGFFDQYGIVYGDCDTSGTPSDGGGCKVDLAASNNANPEGERVQDGPEQVLHRNVQCEAFGGGGSSVSVQQASGECFVGGGGEGGSDSRKRG